MKPDISYLDYKGVEKLINSNEDRQWEYYGNCVDYVISSGRARLIKHYSGLRPLNLKKGKVKWQSTEKNQ